MTDLSGQTTSKLLIKFKANRLCRSLLYGDVFGLSGFFGFIRRMEIFILITPASMPALREFTALSLLTNYFRVLSSLANSSARKSDI